MVMKVLILHHQMGFYGGAEELIVRLSNYLIRNGHKVSVITLSKPPEDVHCNAEFIVPETEFKYNTWNLNISDGILLLKKIYALNKLYKEHVNDFDIVNIHNFPACWAAFPKVKPVVWMCNEPPDLWYDSDNNHGYFERILRSVFLGVNRMLVDKCIDEICVSDNFNARRAKERYGKPVHIVPYGIDFDFYLQCNNTSRFTDFTVLQVGVISKEKNQLESVKAIEKLKNTIPDIRLVLVGMDDGCSYSMELRKYIDDHCLVDNVIMLGHMPRDDVKELYHICDVAVFPIKSKGGWLSPFEAMCCGKPVIVSTEMTASDIIRKERIGIVSDDTAGAILDVYHNWLEYTEMVERGKMFVRDNLSWDKYCQGMIEIMNNYSNNTTATFLPDHFKGR